MIYGLVRISAVDQGLGAQVTAQIGTGTEKAFREVASGAKTDRPELAGLLGPEIERRLIGVRESVDDVSRLVRN